MKRLFFCAALALLLLCGCAAEVDTPQTTEIDTQDFFSDRDFEVGFDETTAVRIALNSDGAACNDETVQISGSTVTVTAAGTYLLSGTLEDGMLIVDAAKTDKVRLVLDGVSIHCATSAAVYVRRANKVFLTTAADSQNALSCGESFVAIDENDIDAAVFSRDALTLNGQGTLAVDAPGGHGVVCKDNLVVTGGSYTVTAARHGLCGKDSVRIAGGTFDIAAEKDGIHADNSDDDTRGFVVLRGGSFTVTAGGDGVSASGTLLVEDGEYRIVTGGGSDAALEDSTSAKGMKSGGACTVLGGSFVIDAADDALHSDDALRVGGGSLALSAGDDGLHADGLLTVSGGDLTISKSYEGIEGLQIEITGGTIDLTASDDGLNAADGSGIGDVSSECSIHISGGVLHIDAGGDGMDSNGSLTISGGETYISGPTDGGNGALDFGTDATVTGGILLAAGSSAMAENFGTASTQGAILLTVGAQAAGTAVTLTDSAGEVLPEWTPKKFFECVNVTCPALVQGGTYTLTVGDFSKTLTLDTLIYGTSGGMGGFGGKDGFGSMQPPGDRPDPGKQDDMPEKPADMPEKPAGLPQAPDGIPEPPNGMTPPDGMPEPPNADTIPGDGERRKNSN